jgi:hypothetical protein
MLDRLTTQVLHFRLSALTHSIPLSFDPLLSRVLESSLSSSV